MEDERHISSLTLREHIATECLAALAGHPTRSHHAPSLLVDEAVKFADALILKLNQPKGEKP